MAGCPVCGSMNVTCHGSYFRKRAGVYVKRLHCNACGATPGVLPPFLLPHKHYPVTDVLPVVKDYLQGSEGLLTSWLNSAAAEISFSAFLRWLKILSDMAGDLHRIGASALAEWKPGWRFEKDKRMNAASFPLAGNVSLNQLYQIFVMEDYFVFNSVSREDFFPWLIFQSRQRSGPA